MIILNKITLTIITICNSYHHIYLQTLIYVIYVCVHL